MEAAIDFAGLADGHSPPVGASLDLFANRYRLGRLLSETAGLRSYLATDTASGRGVVLRATAVELSPTLRLRLEREAIVVRSVQSKLLSPLLEFEQADEQLYWTRPFHEG